MPAPLAPVSCQKAEPTLSPKGLPLARRPICPARCGVAGFAPPLLAAPTLSKSALASEQEFADFLRDVEKRAYKRALFHVKDENAALDIVQDSMLRLAEHYADKPVEEMRMLFSRILINTTMDWFRRQKTRKAVISNFSDFERSGADEKDQFSLLEHYIGPEHTQQCESAESATERKQVFEMIEDAIGKLPARQREAFIMRYWEDMDVAETAAAMGCSEGSVKTHCHRAVQALSQMLGASGIKL